MDSPEVLIIGGGLVGCLCALRLAERGARVTVLEKSVPGAEASSAAAGILAGQSESRQPGVLFDLAVESRALYVGLAEELRERAGVDVGYRRCGVLEVARDEAALAELARTYAWQSERGQRVEVLRSAELFAREPGLSPRLAGALWFPDDAQVEPARLVSAVAQAAERAGVRFRSGAYVRRVVVASGTARGVELDDGAHVAADQVVLAAGAWSSLVQGAALPEGAVRPARGQIVELSTRTPPAGAVVFGDGGYVVPRADGRVVCGSTLEFVGFRNEVTAGGMLRVLAMAVGLVPALEHAPVARSWSNFRPYTPDGAPLVGDPGIAGLTIATGHYRSGILMAPVTAELVCERVLGRRTRPGLAVIAPARAGLDGSTRS
jgi:glycine oxidase